MRGEFATVWEETHRCIWEPLAAIEDVSADIHSQLYQELWKALKLPTGAQSQCVPLGDAIQLREAFFRVVTLSGCQIEHERTEDAFRASQATDAEECRTRRILIEQRLGELIGDLAQARRLLDVTLSALGEDVTRRTEARERVLEIIVNDTARSKVAFQAVRSEDLVGERAVVSFLESAFEVLGDIGGDSLSNQYFTLLAQFIDRFSLRYDLRRPCLLCPTLQGVFASLVWELRALTALDAHLNALMKDFESAVRDLRQDCSDGRIKTCIQKQVNLLEAIGRMYPGVTGRTLGAICDQVGTWPHEKLKASMKDLYGFANDYPGIRHGGTPTSALRAVDMRDMVAMSILLAGFTPYLSNALNLELVYRGA